MVSKAPRHWYSAAVTAGTLVVLLSMRNAGGDRGANKVGKIDILVFISVLACLSGTGFAMFALYYLLFAVKPVLLLILAAVSSFNVSFALTAGKSEYLKKFHQHTFILGGIQSNSKCSYLGNRPLGWLLDTWNARNWLF